MDELTQRAKIMESKIVAAVNESELPLIFADYVLQNILYQIRQAENNQQAPATGDGEPCTQETQNPSGAQAGNDMQAGKMAEGGDTR